MLFNIYIPTDICSATLACEHGGYTDPTDCSACVCPDGVAGTLCTEVAPANGGLCHQQFYRWILHNVLSIQFESLHSDLQTFKLNLI